MVRLFGPRNTLGLGPFMSPELLRNLFSVHCLWYAAEDDVWVHAVLKYSYAGNSVG